MAGPNFELEKRAFVHLQTFYICRQVFAAVKPRTSFLPISNYAAVE